MHTLKYQIYIIHAIFNPNRFENIFFDNSLETTNPYRQRKSVTMEKKIKLLMNQTKSFNKRNIILKQFF